MSEDGIFRIDKKDHVAWLVLNRPDRRNVMDGDFFTGLTHHIRKLGDDPEVRVVVIRGEGKSFTAGLDLAWAGALLSGGAGADAREYMRREIVKLQESMNVVEQCPKPVVAAIHSHCIGGGMDLCSACDIRIASEDAVFSVRETRLAIVADLGTLQRLPFLVGQGRARELALTGRDFTAREALEMGFITTLCKDQAALLAEAETLADQLAALPPLTLAGIKDVMNFSRDNGVYPGLAHVAQKNAAALPSEDLLEAVGAFMEKRAPRFKGK
ncbi:MAG: enoyl-CoA hydratase/isomerase family protein [Proteobacteria bacterium]|nr:enoyl-CoA hydratase/isomerase family protein [Pseudomonadota bacterium]